MERGCSDGALFAVMLILFLIMRNLIAYVRVYKQGI